MDYNMKNWAKIFKLVLGLVKKEEKTILVAVVCFCFAHKVTSSFRCSKMMSACSELPATKVLDSLKQKSAKSP